MKIAVISDLHANFEALKAVHAYINAWKPSHVIVAGDIVNRGPRPLECLDFILEQKYTHGWRLLRGNHEDYVISWAITNNWHHGPAADVHQASCWTYQKLNRDVTELQAMPFQQSLWGPDGREVRFTHASMLGNRDGVYPETGSSSIIGKIIGDSHHPIPALFCVGHTHRPLIRQLKNVLVVNAGSSGLPFDSKWRPSYAQLTWNQDNWSAKIVRVDYDITKAVKDFDKTGYLRDAGPLTKLVLIELREARSQLYQWVVTYQKRVLDGELTMQESVDQFLRTSGK
jgi:predicted phosphodiesterase